ncbi:hypothetical protein [Dysgonomonas sp. ZJ279]|uniref:hypothetical protein n=1 Tax=Dysgonomonas sp. ZJ279 TaxID=2709796 RepID=UPI0013EAF573|nr:hypothetical protein [Dysgonomonas sp. ZJ279]
MIEIGLIKYAPSDLIVDIFDKQGSIKAKYVIGDDAIYCNELMNQHYIEFSFVLDRFERFDRGDYLFYEGYKYYVLSDYIPEESDSSTFKYTLRFDGEEMMAASVQFYYLSQGLKESTWSLTSKASSFLQVAADNLNRYFDVTDFAVGTVEPAEIKSMSFDNSYVFDALTNIAQEFECEWYISGRTINLVQKLAEGAEVDFENEVSVLRMSNSRGAADKKITRMLALGSSRNIPTNYRSVGTGEAVDAIYQKRLRIPASKGNYIDAKPNMTPEEVIEGTVVFEDAYPQFEGIIETVSIVPCTDTDTNTKVVTNWNAYRFTDSKINFKKDYLLPGTDLMIHFKSGNLNGFDFKVMFNPLNKPETDAASQVFEIYRDEYTNIPNDIFKPVEKDEYILYGFNIALVGDQYVPRAEQELYEKAVKWLDKNNKDTDLYECPTVIEYFYKNKYDLQIGKKVRLINDRFENGYRSSRIMGFEKKLINKYDAVYKVGDNPEYKRITNLEETVKEQEIIIESNTNQSLQSRQNGVRNTQNLRALKGLIFDPDGYFDNTQIKPNSIETMYLAVGAKSQDFTTSGVSIKTNKDGNSYRATLSVGYINHRSLWWGGETETPASNSPKYTWKVTQAFNQILQDNAASYYMYVKAEKQSDSAAWELTTNQLKYADDTNYFYFLMGVIYPAKEDRRDVSLTNGMAYISGGSIYGDVIKSINYVDDEDKNEGSKYDLNNGSIRIGNKVKGLLFDATNKVFKLFGITLEFRDSKDKIVTQIKEDGSALFCNENVLFNSDGSGQLAKDIRWDKYNTMFIGDFEIFNSFLRYKKANGTSIYLGDGINSAIDNTDSTFLINNKNTDLSQKIIININSQPPSFDNPLMPLQNIALNISKGAFRVSPNNIIDTPGLLFAGRINSSCGVLYMWGRGGRGKLNKDSSFAPSRISEGEYKIEHFLGHNNYVVNVTPYDYPADCVSSLHSVTNDDFVILFRKFNAAKVNTNFFFTVFGENTNDSY